MSTLNQNSITNLSKAEDDAPAKSEEDNTRSVGLEMQGKLSSTSSDEQILKSCQQENVAHVANGSSARMKNPELGTAIAATSDIESQSSVAAVAVASTAAVATETGPSASSSGSSGSMPTGTTKLYMDQETYRLFASSDSNQATEEMVNESLESYGEEMGLIDVDKTTEEAALTCTSIAGKNGKAFFPMKLYDIVSDEANEEIIKWLPGGKAFIIVDKKRFASEILPVHFQQSQFTSFTRKLSRWKFTRVPRGPFIGAYYNKLFLKGHRSMCWHMRCKNENGGKPKFDNKTSDSITDVNALNVLKGFDPSRLIMGGSNPPLSHGLSLQGYQRALASMSLFPQMPLHYGQQIPQSFAAMQMNNGLGHQMLALEGRIRELQNSNNAFNLLDSQHNSILTQHALDEVTMASQQAHQQARGLEARAAVGVTRRASIGAASVGFSNPFTLGRQPINQNDSSSQEKHKAQN